MATTKKYNPYDDVKAIVHQKSLYDQAKAEGKDPSQYQQEAVQYYNNLRNNGYSNDADKLVTYGYKEANDYLNNNFQPSQEYDEWYDNITGDIVKQQANNEVQSETVKNLMDTYNSNNNLLNGSITYDANGNVVSGLNLDNYNTGKNQLSYINDYDITAQPWYSSLMAGYQLQGQDAANGELASGASTNSGNIDSYAAANANRQQLAFTNAGNEAARALAAQNMQAWQNLYDSMSNNLATMGDQNNTLLATGADYYATDSAERQNALNTAAALEQQKLQNQINELMANISAGTERYTSDNTLKGTLDTNEKNLTGTLDYNAKNLEGTKITSANDLAAAIRQAEADEYGYDMDYQGVLDTNAKNLEGTKYKIEEAYNDSLDEPLSFSDAMSDLLGAISSGELTYNSWDELEEDLISAYGYDPKEVEEKLAMYASRYATPKAYADHTATGKATESSGIKLKLN